MWGSCQINSFLRLAKKKKRAKPKAPNAIEAGSGVTADAPWSTSAAGSKFPMLLLRRLRDPSFYLSCQVIEGVSNPVNFSRGSDS